MARPGVPEYSFAFRRRRAANWLTLGMTYAGMYMARYNFSFANKDLSETYGWDKTEIGAIISAASLVYGIAAIFNGPIADKLGGRRAMIIGACGAAIFNFAFGLGAYLKVFDTAATLLVYLTTVWTLNMFFQSYSALALIKVNSGWFHRNERGVFSAIFGSIIQSGRAAVYLLFTTAAVVALPWQWRFFIPSAIVAVYAVATAFIVRDTPKDAGFEELDTQDATSGDKGAITVAYVLRKIMLNPVALTIAAAEFCTGIVRKGFEEWFPRYMQEHQGLPTDHPVFQKNAFAIVVAGIAGAFVAGTASDWIFKSRRAPVALIGYLIQTGCLLVVWKSKSIDAVQWAFVFNSLAISMVHSMLSGTASMDFGGKRAAATAAGLFDGMQYVGGAVMGVGMGAMLDAFGWESWAPSMIGFSFLGAILMAPLWNAQPKGPGGH